MYEAVIRGLCLIEDGVNFIHAALIIMNIEAKYYDHSSKSQISKTVYQSEQN